MLRVISVAIGIIIFSISVVNNYQHKPKIDTKDHIGEFLQSLNHDKELRCLVDNVFHEARGEPKQGRLYVAIVTLARMKSKRWPNTICEVVYQRKQFSWTLMSEEELIERANNEQEQYENIKNEVSLWMEHDSIPKLDIFHYAHKDVDNYWTKTMKPIERIGNHIFYKN